MHSEIQSIKAQPLAMQKQLLKRRDETKAAQEEVKAVKTKAVIEIEEIKRQAAEQLALNKFGPGRFGTNNDSIKILHQLPIIWTYSALFSVCSAKCWNDDLLLCFWSKREQTRL